MYAHAVRMIRALHAKEPAKAMLVIARALSVMVLNST